MIVFIDTELDGVPNPSISWLSPSQPHCTQLAAVLDDEGRDTCLTLCISASQNGFQSYVNSSASYEGARGGILEHRHIHALNVLTDMLNCAKLIVAHNVSHDFRVLRREYTYAGIEFPWMSKGYADTMKGGLKAGLTGDKYPTLMQAYCILVNPEGFEKPHNALNDALACRAVYYKLLDGGHMKS